MNKKIFFYFVIILISSLAKAQPAIYTDCWEPIPGRVYRYNNDIITGLKGLYSSYRCTHKWDVENGKIMDKNGDFTLTSLTDTTESYIDFIYVKWDCSGSRGTITYNDDVAQIVLRIQSCQSFNPNPLTYNSHILQGCNVVMRNSSINENTDINGYKSVRLLPSFHIYSGTKVHIYNDPDPDSLLVNLNQQSTKLIAGSSLTEDTLSSRINVPSLSQNVPNPFINESKIECYIPVTSNSADLNIYDITGSIVKHISITGKGNLAIKINAEDLNNGLYKYALIVDGVVIGSKSMVVTKN